MKKKIVITGGSSGIGLELTEYFLKKNYYVFTTYYSSNKNLRELKEINKKKFFFQKMDLNKLSDVKKFTTNVNKKFKSVDIIIVNAISRIKRNEFKKINIKEYSKILKDNLLSNIFFIKGLEKFFLQKKKLKIIHISSKVSKIGSWGLSAYGPLKSAIDNFFKCLNYEYKRNIEFKSIYLGAVNTKGYKFTNGNRVNNKISDVKKTRLEILKNL